MRCSKPECHASIFWHGAPDDPALAKFAQMRGWRLMEGRGWRCPHHQKESVPHDLAVHPYEIDTVRKGLE